MKVIETMNDANTPKLEKYPNSRIGRTDVKQNETNPAKVVSAASATGFPIFRINSKMSCS
jgi:hypothetical protein